jgi:hypothetical protein
MSRKARVVIAILAVVVLAIGLRVGYQFVRFSRVERAFGSINQGQGRASVIEILGMPNYYSGKCGVIHNPRMDCALEYVYSHPFAPLLPDYYIISFSADDRVIEADRWVSP